MLLVIDVGNTNTVIGIFEGEVLKNRWRVVTRRDRTADEYFILFRELLSISSMTPESITGVSVSCVVPPLLPTITGLARKYLKVEPLVVGPGVKTGISIHVDNPREVGADRIVNAVAAYQTVQSSAIVIDFGTATTFDYISSEGVFEGGVIAPGLIVSMEALFKEASKLPRVELTSPRQAIGKNTVAAMQSGIIFGYAGMVDSMVDRIKNEVAKDRPSEPAARVVATGGLACLLAAETRSIVEVDEDLTLRGLHLIHRKNQDSRPGRDE